MAGIDDIEETLLERARDPSAKVEDLSKIADALKAVAETRLSELNAKNKARETRLESQKTWAAFLVPIVSLAALFGTVIAQNRQMEATRQQLEDTEWRDVLGSLKNTSESVYSDPTVAPRLRSFFASPVYGDQAKSIASRLMGHISNPDGFRDLFTAVFGEVNGKNVESALDISRTLRSSQDSLHSQCNDMMREANIPYEQGLVDCGEYSDDARAAELMAKVKAPSQIGPMRRALIQLQRENGFLCNKIFIFLRTAYADPRDRRANPGLDLDSVNLVLGDLSNVDFTDFSVAGTIFDTIDFRGAILNPKVLGQAGSTPAQPPDFRGSPWWEARYVEPSLLSFLLTRYWPYPWAGVRYPAGYHITKDDYNAKIRQLCSAAKIQCPAELKFGT